MGKAIINKHYDNSNNITLENFVSDETHRKGEIIICNDSDSPGIFILDTKNEVRSVGGSGSSSVKEEFTVAGLTGGQLGNYTNGQTITAGTDVMTIIKNILCTEIYPTPTITQSNVTTTMKDLTLIVEDHETKNSYTDDKNPLEVGSLIKLISGTTNGMTVNVTYPKISGMINGYKYNNVSYTGDTVSGTCTYSITNSAYTLSVSLTGFTGDTATNKQTSPTINNSNNVAYLSEEKLGCLNEGNNTIKIMSTGATYSYTSEKIGPVYYKSNIGNISDDKYCGVDEKNNISVPAPSKNKEIEITGKYKYFLGCLKNEDVDSISGTSTDITAIIRNETNIIKEGWVNINTDTVILGGTDEDVRDNDGKSIYLACPQKYKLKTFTNENGNSLTGNFGNTPVDIKTGSITSKYNIYIYNIRSGVNLAFKGVKIGLNN